MKKHLLYWFPVVDQNIYGKPIASELPELVDIACGRTLLADAIRMPKKTAVTFEEAIRMLSAERMFAFYGHDFEFLNWLDENFVKWISEQGFHIELTGDEFELLNMPVLES